jgi:MoxR-like ATPase
LKSNKTEDVAQHWLRDIGQLKANIGMVIQGKESVIDRLLTALLAGGHVLIEDVPGVGKSTLAHAMAVSVACSFRRVQFTADMLPSDLIGVMIYNQKTEIFEFRPGPLFAQIVLADEINRASPRTQSALLEAMNEGQITVDRQTYPLEHPFLVLATQNPTESYGTYPLPDSQYDRFLMRIRVGYPSEEVEQNLLRTRDMQNPIERLGAVIDSSRVIELQQLVDRVKFDDALQNYLYQLVAESRRSALLAVGVSTRGALQFHRAVRAYALVHGREYVLPDDIKQLAVECLAHRVMLKQRIGGGGWTSERGSDTEQVILEILERLPVPL